MKYIWKQYSRVVSTKNLSNSSLPMAKKMKFYDTEEQKLRESIHKWDYISSKENMKNIKKVEEFVKNHKAKKLISLRISESDLLAIQAKAIDKWVPYQTYINMLIHQDVMS